MRSPLAVDSLPLSLLSLISLLGVSSAVNINCNDIIVDKHQYNFSPLKGPHAVHWLRQEDPALPTVNNFTFTVDLCAPLKRPKGASKDQDCPDGTYVCGIDRLYNGQGDSIIHKIAPIAGNFITQSGKTLDPKWTRFKDSASHSDAEKNGLRLELNGGKFPFSDPKGRPQKAIIEFLCDKNKTGLEGDEDGGYEEDKDAAKDGKRSVRRDGEEGDKKGDGEKPQHSLTFVSYKAAEDQDVDILRLNWTTKYACEGESENVPRTEHWGFFTWLIIIVFLSISAYLIFGSWLNYNRYGARGWDLLPHGDTIRDVPYYLKDYARRIVGAFQSPASRGGYSAV